MGGLSGCHGHGLCHLGCRGPPSKSTRVLQVRSAEEIRDELNDEWSRLQLEKATWARHNLVEEAARKELGMVTPGPSDIVVIQLGTTQ